MGTKIARIALAFIMLVCQGGSIESGVDFSQMPVQTELRLEESLEIENTEDGIDICEKLLENNPENKDVLNNCKIYKDEQVKEAFNTRDVYIKEYNESSCEEDKNIKTCSKQKKSKEFLARASWYGPGFHGRQTANGEVFNENELTAAHKDLAFGTKIKVTNLANGKSIIVKVNDRGPYIEGRQLDLSKGAAQKLDMIETGVADVKMEILQ